jgi:Na+-driven multidrug efflux pump
MLLISIVYLLFAKTIVGLFKDEPGVIDAGALCLQIIAIGYVFYGYGMVLTQSFNGAGDTKTPTVINFFCFWLFQIPLAYFTALTLNWGPLGVYLAIMISQVLIAGVSYHYFKKGKWKTIEV